MFGVGRSAFAPSPYELDRGVCACRPPEAWLSSGACSPVWRLFASAATLIDGKMPSLKAAFYRLFLVRPQRAQQPMKQQIADTILAQFVAMSARVGDCIPERWILHSLRPSLN